MYVAVQDTNNHDPILSQEVYEYHFGMPIPKNYDLNNFFRIQAKELDFSNDRLRFEVDFNENVRLEYNIYKEYYSNDYKPEFSTLKQLKGPFNQEYSLTVTVSIFLTDYYFFLNNKCFFLTYRIRENPKENLQVK